MLSSTTYHCFHVYSWFLSLLSRDELSLRLKHPVLHDLQISRLYGLDIFTGRKYERAIKKSPRSVVPDSEKTLLLRLTVLCLIAAQDSLSDDALMPLKSYKYSSVDKSFISRYVLKHYVRRS